MNLQEFTTEQLLEEIELRKEKEKEVRALIEKQNSLQQEMQKLSEQIKNLSLKSRQQVVAHVEKIKPQNYVIKKLAVSETVLKERIKEIMLKNRHPMKTKDIVIQLMENGWETQSKDPYYPVAAMLASSSLFVRVSKGIYALRSET